jgi:riboflavin synthase alpha subunit
MFTGLVESVGLVIDRNVMPGGAKLRIEAALARELAPGDSLAVNGVCLTVIRTEGSELEAELGPETMRVTTLGSLPPRSAVNLERPLVAGERLGGHFVQGHVDAVGIIQAHRPDAGFHWITVSFPGELAPYIIPKGSIAVDGISLTVAALGEDRFDVQVIPYTLEHTSLGRTQLGDAVNLECDLVGKYVVRAMQIAEASRIGPCR